MVRHVFAWAAACLVALTTGCRMCADPYDYCGPTFTGEDCQQCMPNARACSILSPGAGPACCGAEMAPQMVPVPGEYGGTVLETPDGQTAVGHLTEKPAGTDATARPQHTAAGPADHLQ